MSVLEAMHLNVNVSVDQIKFIPREARPKAERSEVTNRVAFGQTNFLFWLEKMKEGFLL